MVCKKIKTSYGKGQKVCALDFVAKDVKMPKSVSKQAKKYANAFKSGY